MALPNLTSNFDRCQLDSCQYYQRWRTRWPNLKIWQLSNWQLSFQRRVWL